MLWRGSYIYVRRLTLGPILPCAQTHIVFWQSFGQNISKWSISIIIKFEQKFSYIHTCLYGDGLIKNNWSKDEASITGMALFILHIQNVFWPFLNISVYSYIERLVLVSPFVSDIFQWFLNYHVTFQLSLTFAKSISQSCQLIQNTEQFLTLRFILVFYVSSDENKIISHLVTSVLVSTKIGLLS